MRRRLLARGRRRLARSALKRPRTVQPFPAPSKVLAVVGGNSHICGRVSRLSHLGGRQPANSCSSSPAPGRGGRNEAARGARVCVCSPPRTHHRIHAPHGPAPPPPPGLEAGSPEAPVHAGPLPAGLQARATQAGRAARSEPRRERICQRRSCEDGRLSSRSPQGLGLGGERRGGDATPRWAQAPWTPTPPLARRPRSSPPQRPRRAPDTSPRPPASPVWLLPSPPGPGASHEGGRAKRGARRAPASWRRGPARPARPPGTRSARCCRPTCASGDSHGSARARARGPRGPCLPHARGQHGPCEGDSRRWGGETCKPDRPPPRRRSGKASLPSKPKALIDGQFPGKGLAEPAAAGEVYLTQIARLLGQSLCFPNSPAELGVQILFCPREAAGTCLSVPAGLKEKEPHPTPLAPEQHLSQVLPLAFPGVTSPTTTSGRTSRCLEATKKSSPLPKRSPTEGRRGSRPSPTCAAGIR